MARRPRNLTRIRVMVVSVVSFVQVPALFWLTRRIHSPWPIGAAAALSLPFLWGLRNPFDDRPKGLLQKAVLMPFFAWWTSCLAFAVLAPLALAAAWLLHAPRGHVLEGGAAIALLAGLRAVFARPRLRRLDVHIPDLPRAFDGYRIGQISDVHCGSYTSPARVAQWVRRLNVLDLDLVAVTGDLITSGSAYVEPVARVLGGLRARDGVFACMGNHDYFTDGDEFALLLAANGLRVLRNQGDVVRREAAQLYVAGVDDTWTGRHDVGAALAQRPPGAPTVLLAHDPNLFPLAAEQGVELTLSGHTHGGQVAVPWLSRSLTLARLITRFTAGLYREGRSQLYVNRGAGTTGPPVRLGAFAELTVLTLRCL